MIRRCFANWLQGLKYIFTPIGTLALGVLLGFAVLLPMAGGALRQFGQDVAQIAGRSAEEMAVPLGEAQAAFYALDWENDADAAFRTLLSREFWQELLQKSADEATASAVEFRDRIGEVIAVCVGKILTALFLFIVWCVIGLAAGYLITRLQIRHEIARRSPRKWLTATVINAFVGVPLLTAGAWLLAAWRVPPALALLLFAVIANVVSIVQAYLIHARGKMRFKDAVNPKTVSLLLLCNTLLLLMAAGLSIAMFILIRPVIGIFVGMALVEVTVIVMGGNAESYVKERAALTPPAADLPAET